MTEIVATCHCGAIALRATLIDGLDSLRRCACSFCMRRGAPAVTALARDVTVIRGEDALRLYQFGTMTARHHFCGTCGIYTHHQRYSDPRECGINAACIEGVDLRDLGSIPWSERMADPR